MMTKRNAFTSLCILASQERWCWKMFCTTCGHMHFRCGFFELSEGRHPDNTEWFTRGNPNNFRRALGGMRSISEAMQESERLHQVLAEASLMEIASLCGFPDYLGYLGLGLHYTNRLEQQNRLLTPLWGQQLLDMVDDHSQAAVLLKERLSGSLPLVWSDIDGMERAIRPVYRGNGPTDGPS